MANIPTYLSQESPGGGLPGQQSEAYRDTTPTINLTGMVDPVLKLLKQKQESDENQWVIKASADLQLETFKTMQDAQQNAAPGAPDFTQQFQDHLDKRYNDISQQAPSKRAQDAFNQRFYQLRNATVTDAMQFEATMRGVKKVGDYKEAYQSSSAAVALDPSKYDMIMQQVGADLETLRPGVDQKTFNELQQQTMHDLALTRANAWLLKDPRLLKEKLTMPQVVSEGLVQPGNIDIFHRPVHQNEDGSISTVASMSIGVDGKEVLIPTIAPDGSKLSEDEAIALYKETGQHLGIFNDAKSADAYAEALHKQQEDFYVDNWTTGLDGPDIIRLQAGVEARLDQIRRENIAKAQDLMQSGVEYIARNGKPMPGVLEAVQALDDPDVLKEYKSSAQLASLTYNATSSTMFKPLDEQIATAKGILNINGQRDKYADYAKAEDQTVAFLQARWGQFQANKVGYLMQNDRVRAAVEKGDYQPLIEAQRSMGVEDVDIELLPKEEVEQIGKELALQDTDAAMARLDAMQEQFGGVKAGFGRTGWDLIFSQLSKSKSVDPNYMFFSSMDDKPARNDWIQAHKEAQINSKTLGTANVKIINDSVLNKFADFSSFAASESGQGSTYTANLRSLASERAMQLTANGMEYSKAVNMAYDEVIGKYYVQTTQPGNKRPLFLFKDGKNVSPDRVHLNANRHVFTGAAFDKFVGKPPTGVDFKMPLQSVLNISSPYGSRNPPMQGATSFHQGVDMTAPEGTQIRSTGAGVVRLRPNSGGSGNMVEIDHGNGVVSKYLHMKGFNPRLKDGQRVQAGEFIGQVGTTGRSTGPHLHFEVWQDGKAIDPMKFLADVKSKKLMGGWIPGLPEGMNAAEARRRLTNGLGVLMPAPDGKNFIVGLLDKRGKAVPLTNYQGGEWHVTLDELNKPVERQSTQGNKTAKYGYGWATGLNSVTQY